MFKTPKFWEVNSKINSTISFILLPLSLLFITGTILRKIFTTEQKLKGKFVICIGNVTLGGNGKTPTTIALYHALSQNFPNDVCIITKGYGRKTKGFVVADKNINPNTNTFHIGDEPTMMVQFAPVYLFTTIKDIIKNIDKIKESVIITDDGMQNPSLYKDFTLLIIGEQLFGNGKIFPAGSLRESPRNAIKKANAVLFTGQNIISHFFSTKQLMGKPHYTIKQDFTTEILPQNEKNIIAFSGLGNNSKFKASLERMGFTVKKFFEFPDHHQYTPREVEKIINQSNDDGNELPIITTEKDWVKLTDSHKNRIKTLKIEYILDTHITNQIIEEINLRKSFTNANFYDI